MSIQLWIASKLSTNTRKEFIEYNIIKANLQKLYDSLEKPISNYRGSVEITQQLNLNSTRFNNSNDKKMYE